MFYRIPKLKQNLQTNIFDIGRWAGEKFGWEDTWRFRNGLRHIVSSDRFWRTVRFIEIDKPEDCLAFELRFGTEYRIL